MRWRFVARAGWATICAGVRRRDREGGVARLRNLCLELDLRLEPQQRRVGLVEQRGRRAHLRARQDRAEVGARLAAVSTSLAEMDSGSTEIVARGAD
eukprot:6184078-Pleurochrysis_carterae.AAC.2